MVAEWCKKFIAKIKKDLTLYRYPHDRMFRLSSPYGWRTHPITKKQQFHNGIDTNAPCGENIYSIGMGKVIYTHPTDSGVSGKFLRIEHWNGQVSGYAHLSRILVNEGDYVTKKTIIGLVGTTGRSTGCHLHLTIWKNSKRSGHVDPLPLLKDKPE